MTFWKQSAQTRKNSIKKIILYVKDEIKSTTKAEDRKQGGLDS